MLRLRFHSVSRNPDHFQCSRDRHSFVTILARGTRDNDYFLNPKWAQTSTGAIKNLEALTIEVKEAVLMTEPSHIWVVRTSMRDLHGWYYVGVETESEAHGLVGKKRPGETFIGAKRIKNVEHVKAHELRPVPIGNYWGPLIPE
jgi:hypothetical protein